MASLYKLKCGFTFTDTTLTCYKNTFTIYINKYSVDNYTRCKLYLKPSYYFR